MKQKNTKNTHPISCFVFKMSELVFFLFYVIIEYK